MYASFVFFLLRPNASAYFTHSDNVPKSKTWHMIKTIWTDSAIEDLNAIGESLVELPEPKPKKKKKL